MVLAPMKHNPAILHDCGVHGQLTRQQIALKAGVSKNTIIRRIQAGATGEELFAPAQRRGHASYYRHNAVHTAGNSALAVALLLVRDFPKLAPTMEQLRDRYGMSRATAYRWRAAFIDIIGAQR